jgi:RimJ/RimL family protein N-acetyltransferase
MIFREATKDDAKILFDWRNDPSTRAVSRDMNELIWEKHVEWLSCRLENKNHGLYVAEVNNEPVGTIRIDDYEISYTVAPSHRRKGTGEAMLIAARETFGQKVAVVKRDNIPSIIVAERAGHITRLID